jgi:hypothetical protein
LNGYRNFRSDLGSEKDSKDSLESFSHDRRKDNYKKNFALNENIEKNT